MGRFKYVSLDRIISKLYRDLGIEDIQETDIIEWAGEALEGIGAPGMYEEAVAIVEVSNHQADLPNGLQNIIQIARDNQYVKQEDCSTPCDIIESICETNEESNCGCQQSTCSDCYSTIVVDRQGKPLFGEDLTYYVPYFNLQGEYVNWTSCDYYRNRYTPVRLTNHSFFNTIVCQEDNTNGLYENCNDEYTIVQDKIRLSFKEGSIAIAYNRYPTDKETGYPMIPDDYSFITAITMYITMKIMFKYWYMGREGFQEKAMKSEEQWQWYCKQSSNKSMIPYGIDGYQNILEQRSYLIPRMNRYYGFFGKLSNKESLKFNNTRL